jgi:hypothetical protein
MLVKGKPPLGGIMKSFVAYYLILVQVQTFEVKNEKYTPSWEQNYRKDGVGACPLMDTLVVVEQGDRVCRLVRCCSGYDPS